MQNSVFKSKKFSLKKGVSLTLRWLLLIFIATVLLLPVFYMVMESVMPDKQITRPTSILPEYFNFESYKRVFEGFDFFKYMGNTFFVAALSIIGVVFAASLTAFGLTKVYFKGQNVFFAVILATVFLPGTVTSLPLYSIYARLGWIGTLTPLWLPLWFGGGAMNIFLLRQFMKGIPNDLSEAAIIDGASSFTIFIKIILPMLKPILCYIGVTTFFGVWNEFQGPLLYLGGDSSSENLWTLSLALYQKTNSRNMLENTQMAIGVLMMVPCIVLFGFFQKQLVDGVATAGLKL